MELYSECCGANHDDIFEYDYIWKLGICDNCKEHTSFEEVEDE